VKKYANFSINMSEAVAGYISEVEGGDFPSTEHTIDMPDEEWELLSDDLDL
jgi:ketopantoate hydroxymethyltransferase